MVFALPALLRGNLGGTAVIDDLAMNFVKREQFAGPVDAAKKIGEKAEEKKEEAARWQDILRAALPKYELSDLVARITPKNRHRETDWGRPQGEESW